MYFDSYNTIQQPTSTMHTRQTRKPSYQSPYQMEGSQIFPRQPTQKSISIDAINSSLPAGFDRKRELPKKYKQSDIFNKKPYEDTPQFQKNLVLFFGADDVVIKNEQQSLKGAQESMLPELKKRSYTQHNNQSQFKDPITQLTQLTVESPQNKQNSRIIVVTEQNWQHLRQTEQYLKQRGILEYEQISIPGGGVGLVKSMLWRNCYCDLTRMFKDIQEVYLFTSTNSAVDILISILKYQGTKELLGRRVENNLIGQYLRDAREIVNGNGGTKIRVNGVILDMRGNGMRVF